jgi:nucleotide-binding universal stress UspA family protein
MSRTMPGVVACFDGSAASTRALDWAADEAALRKTPLTLCHAWQRPAPWQADPAVAGSDPAEATRTLARGMAIANSRHPGLAIVPRLLAGPAAPALLQAADGAELLVAGTRGTGSWQWPGLGSVSTQLAVGAQCPLLLVPDDGIWRQAPIIAGVDGSLSSPNVARFAIEEASLREVPVIAVCCPADQCLPGSPEMEGSQDRGELWQQAEERVELATWSWRRKYPEVTVTTSLRDGSPADVLSEMAERRSLLVVGARRYDRVAGPRLGSVTQELLQNAAHPIAVVR